MATPITSIIRGQGKLMIEAVAFYNNSKAWLAQSVILAQSVVIHAHVTGDIRPIAVMIASMPKGSKANALRDYMTAFAPVKWSDTTKKFKFDGTKQVSNIVDNGVEPSELLVKLLSTEWHSMAKAETANSYKPFDMKATLLKLVLKSNKVLEEGDKTKETLTKAEVAALEDLFRKLYPEVKSA